ncbi:hypothetical protein [Bacillus sp. PS06]|nr:hypothetical protein [Bacillus sp. PS06]
MFTFFKKDSKPSDCCKITIEEVKEECCTTDEKECCEETLNSCC